MVTVKGERNREYRRKLENHMMELGVLFKGVDTEENPQADMATFSLSVNSARPHYITIGESYRDEYDIRATIALAHEVGHFTDLVESYGNDARAYGDDYELDTLDVEVSAWKWAVVILDEIGFTEWDTFFIEAISCIASYARWCESKVYPNGMTDVIEVMRNRIESVAKEN